MRHPARESRHHIVQGGGIQRSDHTDSPRPRRDRAFAIAVEKPLLLEPLLELQELLVQRALAAQLHRLDDELQLSTRLVNGEPAAQLDLLAVGGKKLQQAAGTLEHRAAQGRRLAVSVLEREVAVPACRAREP